MSEALTESQAIGEVLQEGNWYWIPGGQIEQPQDGEPMQLWLNGTATELGHYPRESEDEEAQSPGYRAEFHPVHSGWRRYWDTIACLGFIRTEDSEIPAYIVSWPSPEFMGRGNDDSDWFLLRYDEGDITEADIKRWKAGK